MSAEEGAVREAGLELTASAATDCTSNDSLPTENAANSGQEVEKHQQGDTVLQPPELETRQQQPPQHADEKKGTGSITGPGGQAKNGPDGKKAGGGPVTSQSSSNKHLAGSNKLEDQINLQHLVELMKIFNAADENGSDGLDVDEFRAAFGQILGKGKKDQQMAVMFMKIDTNCDGTVDWDEFCTYMLLEYQEKDLMEGEKVPLFPYPLKVLPSCHRDNITKIVPLPTPGRHGNKGGGAPSQREGVDGRFVSVCKDGTICFWKSNHTLQRMAHVESRRSRFTWVTDLVVMANVNKIILSFTDNMLAVYDITTFDLQQQVVGFKHCVLALDYWCDVKDGDHAMLVFGDSGGGVGSIEFFTATSSLFPVRSNTTCRNQEIPVVTFSELIHHSNKSTLTTYLPGIHGDWVCKVCYCPYTELCMSCSNDSECSMHLVDRHGRKEGSVLRVRKGISSFDYCRDWNLIATGGLDRIVRIWNMYIPGKPTAILKGHATAVLHIALHTTYGEVLSFSRDLELRVWDLQDQICLQVCHRFQQLLPQPPSAFCLHPHTGALLIGTNQLGVLEPCRDEELNLGDRKRDRTLSHERPLTAALYNTQFNQVVSGCQGGVVSVWDLDTGEKTMQFSRCHGDMELTAMSFDPSGRRLITGGRDGSLKIWNFNNGACLSVLDSSYSLEVTSVCFLKQRIIVGGWSQLLSAYSDTREPEGSVPKYFGSGEHSEDILSLAGQDPNLLASSSYDGDVLLWNLDIERCVGRLNASRPEMRQPQPVFGCTGKRHLGLVPQSGRADGRRATRREGEEPALHRNKDERAVEKLVFLKLREPSPSVGSLVACGAGGWVHMWNTSGGGLMGEFNVWDNRRHSPPEAERSLHSVTTMHVNGTETVLYTGNSLGYIQLWDITDYCLHQPLSESPETTPTLNETPPPLKLAWRSHISSIVSIDTAEEANMIVTASTDCCVRLWSQRGRYIGTFGQRASWEIPLPPLAPQGGKIIHLIPPDLHRTSSLETINTISGAVKSKWILAKNLLRALMLGVGSLQDSYDAHSDKDHTHQQPPSNENILGRCYQRQTRVRQPMNPQPLQQREGGMYALYSTLACPDLSEPLPVRPPSRAGPHSDNEQTSHDQAPTERAGPTPQDHTYLTHTEANLLQGIWKGQRRHTL